nr:uncharacterized protein LOC123765877 [Procambarus clarkii]
MKELQQVLGGLLMVLGRCLTQQVSHPPHAYGQQTEVEALEGDRAFLPCDMDVPTPGEKVARVSFWHASQHSSIIYRVDVEGKPFAKASHWAPNSYSTRAVLEEQGLVLDDVSHKDEGEYRCQVQFYEAPSRVSRITLTVVDPAISLAIEGGGVVGRAGVPREVEMTVSGSKPPFAVSCLLDGVTYTPKQREVNKFILKWTPSASQHGANLFCDANRTALPGTASVSTKLSVLYQPVVEVRPGINQNLENVQEGDDVNLICVVEANPASADVTWMHDGKIVLEESTTNVLELETVAHSSSGNYSCRASNSEGTTTSESLPLQVKYTPMCVASQKVVTVSRSAFLLGEVTCPVEAYPPSDSFRWAMVTLTGKKKVNPSRYRSSGRVLEFISLKHTALQLHCWGRNEMGEQEYPCVFNIPSPKPEAVSECNVTTTRMTDTPQVSIVVSCVYGLSRHLLHTFTLKLLHPDGKWEQFENKEPVFTIYRLREDVQYQIEVTATNAHGTGESYVFNFTLHSSNNSFSPSEPTTLPAILLPLPLPSSSPSSSLPPPLSSSSLPPPLSSSSPSSPLPASLPSPLPSSFSPFLVLYILISVVLVMGILVVALLVKKLCFSNQARMKPTVSNGHPHHHIQANGGTGVEMSSLLYSASHLHVSPAHITTADSLANNDERDFLLSLSGAPRASIDSLDASLASEASDLGHTEEEAIRVVVPVTDSLSSAVTEYFSSPIKTIETSL